jgi:hypothetical protein
MNSSVKKTGDHILRVSCECGIIHEIEANEKGELNLQSFYPRKEKEKTNDGKIETVTGEPKETGQTKKKYSFFD